MLYNNTATLFAPLKGKATFTIHYGHIVSKPGGVYVREEFVARCKDSADAERVLTEAGFKEENGEWK